MNRGVLFAIGSMTVGGLAGLLDRAASQRGLEPTALLALRGVMAVGIFLGAAGWSGELRNAFRVDSATVAWVLASALAGSLTLGLYFAAVRHGEPTLVFPIVGAWPAMSALFAVVLLGDRPTPMRIAGIVLTLAGVALVGRS